MNKEKEIDMLKEKLDYYTLVAADDEFLDDFWKYCEEREREGKILVQEAVIAVFMMKKVWYYEKKKFANRSL